MPRSRTRWQIREDLRPMLKKVKRLFPTVLGHVNRRRIFLCSTNSKNSKHVANIRPSRPPWGLLIDDYDYCIKISERHFDEQSYEKQLFTLLHELLHIPSPGGQEEDHPNYRRLVDHDIQDFKELRHIYGLHLEKVEHILDGEKFYVESRREEDTPTIKKRKR